MTQHVNLLHKITEGMTLPEGCDAWGIRTVRPDFRSSRGYRWPLPGNWAEASGPFMRTQGECPTKTGDGICLAFDWAGMASGGISARTLLLCAYGTSDVLFAGPSKARLRKAFVADLIDGDRLIREHGFGADLTRANLTGADLTRANLNWADLTGADLTRANLNWADLTGANLTRANLTGANLNWADLTRANLTGANLTGADLYGAGLNGADGAGVIGYTP